VLAGWLQEIGSLLTVVFAVAMMQWAGAGRTLIRVLQYVYLIAPYADCRMLTDLRRH